MRQKKDTIQWLRLLLLPLRLPRVSHLGFTMLLVIAMADTNERGDGPVRILQQL